MSNLKMKIKGAFSYTLDSTCIKNVKELSSLKFLHALKMSRRNDIKIYNAVC